jgi:hypothetical protein
MATSAALQRFLNAGVALLLFTLATANRGVYGAFQWGVVAMDISASAVQYHAFAGGDRSTRYSIF